jgi:hypothetical protein
MEAQLADLDVKDLVLDLENPRFFYLRLKGKGSVSEAELQSEIEKDDSLPQLVKAIRTSGVQDPIWVREENGKYVVIEGNRRTVVLRHLLKDGVKPTKDGVTYGTVKAFILPKGTSPTDTLLQKARLQTGKKEWGAFNVAAVTHALRHQYLMELEDIAAEMQTSIQELTTRSSKNTWRPLGTTIPVASHSSRIARRRSLSGSSSSTRTGSSTLSGLTPRGQTTSYDRLQRGEESGTLPRSSKTPRH